MKAVGSEVVLEIRLSGWMFETESRGGQMAVVVGGVGLIPGPVQHLSYSDLLLCRLRCNSGER